METVEKRDDERIGIKPAQFLVRAMYSWIPLAWVRNRLLPDSFTGVRNQLKTINNLNFYFLTFSFSHCLCFFFLRLQTLCCLSHLSVISHSVMYISLVTSLAKWSSLLLNEGLSCIDLVKIYNKQLWLFFLLN